MSVASFETFGSGSFGGPLGSGGVGGEAEGPPAREASVPAPQGPRK